MLGSVASIPNRRTDSSYFLDYDVFSLLQGLDRLTVILTGISRDFSGTLVG
jgi:hypothetical protein